MFSSFPQVQSEQIASFHKAAMLPFTMNSVLIINWKRFFFFFGNKRGTVVLAVECISYHMGVGELQIDFFFFFLHRGIHLGPVPADTTLHVFNFWHVNNSAEVKLTCDATNPPWEISYYCWEYSMELYICRLPISRTNVDSVAREPQEFWRQEQTERVCPLQLTLQNYTLWIILCPARSPCVFCLHFTANHSSQLGAWLQGHHRSFRLSKDVLTTTSLTKKGWLYNKSHSWAPGVQYILIVFGLRCF